MSRRRRTRTQETSYGRLVAWTTVLALVFSAGLIAGQRLLKRQDAPALVAIAANASADAGEQEPSQAKAAPLSFSFYEKLGVAPVAAPRDAASGDAARQDLGSVMQQALGAPQAAAASAARYTLQVGAHGQLQQANQQLRKLNDAGLSAHMVTVRAEDGAKLYRVRVGKFDDEDEARHFKAELKRKHPELAPMLSPI